MIYGPLKASYSLPAGWGGAFSRTERLLVLLRMDVRVWVDLFRPRPHFAEYPANNTSLLPFRYDQSLCASFSCAGLLRHEEYPRQADFAPSYRAGGMRRVAVIFSERPLAHSSRGYRPSGRRLCLFTCLGVSLPAGCRGMDTAPDETDVG